MNKILFLSVSFFILNLSAIENTGAVSAATGGAGVGALEEVDGGYLNSASIALFSKKSFAASFSKYHSNVHLTDNGRDALFPAGIAYTKTDENNIQTQAYHLLVAYEVVSKISLGLDMALREIKMIGIEEKFSQTIVSPAIFYQITQSISAGFVLKNKALSNTILADSLDQNSSLAMGFSYVYEKFAKFRFDFEAPQNEKTDKMIYKIGLETFINDWIITRIGYQNDNAYSMNYFTAGLGFAGPQFGLHYAYQSEARNNRDPLHTIDLNIPF